jgi:uncharacterized GH25 family protein
MKNIPVLVSMLAALLTFPQFTEGHAIWIESKAQATLHQSHEVKIFYGEYPEGAADSTKKWFSDLQSLDVWVVSPTKKKTKLTLRDAATHLAGSFVPDEEGMYYVTTAHTTKELGGTTKYEFSSVAPVQTGSGAATVAAAEQQLAVIARPGIYRTGNTITVQAWNNGTPFADGEVVIMSPEGWVKTLKAGQNGSVTFTPRLKGSYVIETSDYKPEEGQWNDKKYTHSWKGATTHIVVE